MDYTARDALEAGFDSVVLVLREDVRDEVLAHVARHWPRELEVRPVIQGPVAGTAQAVASAEGATDGPFGVVNADDLYGTEALIALAERVTTLERTNHVIVGYRLADTIITDAPVTRGICETTPDGELVRIGERTVVRAEGGFRATPLGEGEHVHLSGDETVSMNLWGFAPSLYEELRGALDAFDPETAPHPPGKPPELLLPSVVGELVSSSAARVEVAPTEGHCIGITHPDDLAFVRGFVLAARHRPARRAAAAEA